jgi:quinolinate synthase
MAGSQLPQRNLEVDRSMRSSGIVIRPDIALCQTDLPLDWYQEEFKPYAEEYLALPDRKPETVLPWMDRYIVPALDHFGDDLLLLAHFYMGGEIVKLVERYGGHIADSYVLALQAVRRPETRLFVESAVHFMAETIALLAHPHQSVYITNPKSGCTMEDLAKEDMVTPLVEELQRCYGDDLLIVAYMNTSGRIKALAGRTGGAVCTSSNAPIILRWALDQGKKVLFVPDRHLGENTAAQLGLGGEDLYHFPGGWDGANVRIQAMHAEERDKLDRARVLLWGSYCGVHTVFSPEHVAWWRERGYQVLVHPESRREVVAVADGNGSTDYLWKAVQNAPAGARIAIGTEAHFVQNARELGAARGVDVVNLADIPDPRLRSIGCGCATMSRNDPPHLVALLDLLRRGEAPALNEVKSGDVVDSHTGHRERMGTEDRAHLAADARRSLERMIELTEAAQT